MRQPDQTRGSSDIATALRHERSRYSLLLALLALASLMALLTTAEGAIFRAQRGQPIDWALLVGGRFADWYTCAILIPPLYWLTTRFPIERGKWPLATAIHLAAGVAASAVKFTLYVPLRSGIDPSFHRSVAEILSADLLGKLMFFWAVTGMLHAIFFYHRAQAEARQGEALHRKLLQLQRGGSIAVPDGRGLRYLKAAEIDWVQAQGNYALLHTGGKRHMVRETMTALFEKLGSGSFVRVHRSAIVNIASIRHVEPTANGRYRLTLRSGVTVTSGRSYAAGLRRLLSPGAVRH